MNVKLVYPGNETQMVSFSGGDAATLNDLLVAIKPLPFDAKTSLQLLSGFPPSLVQGKASDTLISLGIKTGSKVLLRQGTPCSCASEDAVDVDEVEQTRRRLMERFVGAAVEVEEGLKIAGSDFDLAVEVIEGILEAKGISPAPPSAPREIMVRRVIDADNSCLFNAIGYLLNKSHRSLSYASEFRGLIAGVVLSDPETYSEAFLGKQNSEYAAWILEDEKWGGEIEMSILSKILCVEICAVDIQTNIVYAYGEGQGFDKRIFLLYDGIHFDALARARGSDTSPEAQDQNIFAHDDTEALEGAKALAAELKKRKLFVNLAGCDIKCLVCNVGLQGQKQAQAHAKETGHQNFAAV